MPAWAPVDNPGDSADPGSWFPPDSPDDPSDVVSVGGVLLALAATSVDVDSNVAEVGLVEVLRADVDRGVTTEYDPVPRATHSAHVNGGEGPNSNRAISESQQSSPGVVI